ncbi:MAG: tRNA 2-thiouridine(34) synthase MnmA [Lachnospiraceae bacterium]|nr:tRNA 2-thiouridine(34) synthase MnmA [Lachnospiraceae bacterium]
MRQKGARVAVGLSGGVDSSVAAYLLKEEGYDVIGVTMQTWREGQEHAAQGETMAADAKRVAEALELPHYIIDAGEVFAHRVIAPFVESYCQGKTPNPCVICNRYVKWESLLKAGRELGAEYIATGHYAGVVQLPGGRFTLRKAVGADKDQTYALFNLTQEQLSRTRMPIGAYRKEEVRNIAREKKIPVANKPDSQEICFIPNNDYAAYIARKKGKMEEGNFVTKTGEILGPHRGIMHYTIGQRKGLNLSMGHPVFVTEIRPETGEVVIGDSKELFKDRLICANVNWMAIESLIRERPAIAKIRYAHRGEPCLLRPLKDGRVEVVFEEPVRAITPGQAVVFYEEDYLLGGGIIEKQ